jgi:hypothetical protein
LSAALPLLILLEPGARAQTPVIPESITTPDKVETRIGDLDFRDGYPTTETAKKIQDELDYLHGVEAFMNSIQGVYLYALRKGYAEKGIKDNEFLVFPKLMDSNSLFLTANADTVHFWGNINLEDGPLVMETLPRSWGSSTISGSAGSAISVWPVPTRVKAAST